MRYVLASCLVALEAAVYIGLTVAVGWKSFGGGLLFALFMGIATLTWTGVLGYGPNAPTTPPAPPTEAP